MSWAGACGLFDTVFITDVLSTYPASAFNWNIGFALTARHFFQTPKKYPKRLAPAYGPRFAQVSLAPVQLRGPAVTGHPWPNTALPASMPGCPLRRTSSRPPEGAGSSKALRPEAADRPACLVKVCAAQSVVADEPCEAASGCEATVKPESGIYLNDRCVRLYDCRVAVAHQTERSLRSSSATTEFCARFCDVCDAFVATRLPERHECP